MEQFLEILVNNWQYIGIALVVLLEIVLMIIKKRPKKFDELNQIISQAIAKLPGFIAEAEEMKSYSGDDKKSFVINWTFQFIENALKRDLSASEEQYAFKAISYFIEAILNCPTKKGGYGREEDDSAC